MYSNPLLILFILQFIPSILYATIGQFMFILRTEGFFYWAQTFFSLVLWIYSYLFQINIKEPRPNTYCIHKPGEYGLPSSDYVYLISILSSILFNDIAGIRRNRIVYNVFAITTDILWLTFSCMHCWLIGFCTVKQNIVTVVLGIVPTVLFFPMIYHFIIHLIYYYEPFEIEKVKI